MGDNSTASVLQAPQSAAVITHQGEKPFQASGSQHGTCRTRPSEAHLVAIVVTVLLPIFTATSPKSCVSV